MNQAERTEAIIVWVLLSFFGGWVLSIFGIGIGPGILHSDVVFVILKLIAATAKSNSGEPPEFTDQR